jgi:flagellar biosynthetic protein FliO
MATVAMVGRLLLALCFVLGLMWGIGRWVRGRNNGRKGAAAMAVLGRQQLSRNSSVAVVKVLDQALILGVTEGQISMLGESDLTRFEDFLTDVPQLRRSRQRALPATPVVIEHVEHAVSSGHGASVNGASVNGASVNGASVSVVSADAAARNASNRGALSGSALSLATWRQAVDVIRERSVRRG